MLISKALQKLDFAFDGNLSTRFLYIKRSENKHVFKLRNVSFAKNLKKNEKLNEVKLSFRELHAAAFHQLFEIRR